MAISPDKAVSITVEQIDNGYILAYGSTAGAVIRKFYCESEVAIGEKIIALAGRKKLQGDDAQLKLPLDTNAASIGTSYLTTNAATSAVPAADAAYYAQKTGEHK